MTLKNVSQNIIKPSMGLVADPVIQSYGVLTKTMVNASAHMGQGMTLGANFRHSPYQIPSAMTRIVCRIAW